MNGLRVDRGGHLTFEVLVVLKERISLIGVPNLVKDFVLTQEFIIINLHR